MKNATAVPHFYETGKRLGEDGLTAVPGEVPPHHRETYLKGYEEGRQRRSTDKDEQTARSYFDKQPRPMCTFHPNRNALTRLPNNGRTRVCSKCYEGFMLESHNRPYAIPAPITLMDVFGIIAIVVTIILLYAFMISFS